MKTISVFLLMVLFSSCAKGKETVYIGSTPANQEVRSFLGIPFSDSVDFIRWKITMQDDKYILKCNYGIGKPNTKGFMEGGKWIELNGPLKKEKNYFYLQHGNKTLGIVALNASLLHLVNEDKTMLTGTGGWGYTLSIEKPLLTDQVNLISKQDVLKDSMTFQGRTPCGEFSINRAGPNCIKMKWLLVFYADSRTHEPTTYLLNHSRMNPLEYPGKTGTWKIITGKDGRIIYELKPDNETTITYLLKLDDNILAFTDEKGNLLVGNEDFSFTLSRKL
jgi:hypothetical protein